MFDSSHCFKRVVTTTKGWVNEFPLFVLTVYTLGLGDQSLESPADPVIVTLFRQVLQFDPPALPPVDQPAGKHRRIFGLVHSLYGHGSTWKVEH